MKTGFFGAVLGLSFFLPFFVTDAVAGDEVMMATSEDLNAFDQQLGVAVSQGDKVAKPSKKGNNGLGKVVSAEAKRLKDADGKKNFGDFVREQAIGHGYGAIDGSGNKDLSSDSHGKALGKAKKEN